jgi:hypothetical protein
MNKLIIMANKASCGLEKQSRRTVKRQTKCEHLYLRIEVNVYPSQGWKRVPNLGKTTENDFRLY